MRVRRKSAVQSTTTEQPVRKLKTRALRKPRLVLNPAASAPVAAPTIPAQPITEKLLTIHEVAALLGINWKTVYRNLVKKHQIPVYAIGRSKRYNRQDIENALRQSAGVR